MTTKTNLYMAHAILLADIINYVSKHSLSIYDIKCDLKDQVFGYHMTCCKSGHDEDILQKNIYDFNNLFNEANIFINVESITNNKTGYFIKLYFVIDKNTNLNLINTLLRLYKV